MPCGILSPAQVRYEFVHIPNLRVSECDIEDVPFNLTATHQHKSNKKAKIKSHGNCDHVFVAAS